MAIDLRPGEHDFTVTTQVQGPGNKYDKRMGPEVVVRARDEAHAEQVAREHGHEPNPHFPPRRHRK